MPDREFKIRITGDASGISAASREGAAALEGTARATQKGTEANKEHEKSIFQVESAHRAWHKAMHAISTESPLVGEAMRLWLNPTTGLIMGAVLALEYFMKKQEEAKKVTTEAASEMAAGYMETADAARKLSTAAEESREKFVFEYLDIATAHLKLTERVKETINAINQEKEALMALSKVRGEDEQHRDKIDLDARKKALDAKEAAYAQAGAQIPILAAASERARAEANGPLGIKGEQAAIEHAKAAMKKEQDALGKVSPFSVEADQRKASIDYYQDLIARREARVKELQDNQKAAEGRETENRKTYDALGGELPGLRKDFGIHQSEFSLDSAQPLAAVVGRGSEALNALQQGQKLSTQQNEALFQLTAYLRAIGANNWTMLSAIRGAHGNIEAIAAEVRIIKQRQEQIAKQFQ